MILSFSCKETEKIFHRKKSAKYKNIEHVALRKLTMLNAANNINDLRVPPGNHLEKITGNLKGKYSIKINDQWRIIFEWAEGNVSNVYISDYH
jgi:toxin HigB-1